MTRVVGLTGGIASGKSAVSALFAGLGVPVIDTDLLAREVVAPGQPALAELVAHFGPEILDASGALDRRQLRERVFAEPQQRKALEAVLHPRIRALAQTRLAALTDPYGLLVVPLLVEAGVYPFIERVLVVDVAPEVQLARLCARDGVDRKLAQAMLDAQASRAQRLARADDVIHNDAGLDALPEQVARLHQRYLDWAAS